MLGLGEYVSHLMAAKLVFNINSNNNCYCYMLSSSL